MPTTSRNNIPGIKLRTSDKFEYKLDVEIKTIRRSTIQNKCRFIFVKNWAMNKNTIFNHLVSPPSSHGSRLIGDGRVACRSNTSYVVLGLYIMIAKNELNSK